MDAIRMDGVTKEFGDVVALDGLDLTVESGEIFGFLGPNGAGKSTAIGLMLDFLRPTDGTVEVHGLDAQARSTEVRARTGVLPEGFAVYDRLTGRQHVEFAADSKDAAEDPAALLDRVDLSAAAGRKAGGYSKGMRQRLALAMAIAGEPDLLILDEPTTGLDPAGAREVRNIIRTERDRGATVFFSSHILEQVEAVCDRVGILQDGDLVAVDSIDALRAAAAGGSRLRVEVDGGADAAVEALRTTDGVTAVSADDGTLSVTCEPAAKLRALNAVEAAGARVRDFETVETSLEDLFLSYTGEEASA